MAFHTLLFIVFIVTAVCYIMLYLCVTVQATNNYMGRPRNLMGRRTYHDKHCLQRAYVTLQPYFTYFLTHLGEEGLFTLTPIRISELCKNRFTGRHSFRAYKDCCLYCVRVSLDLNAVQDWGCPQKFFESL